MKEKNRFPIDLPDFPGKDNADLLPGPLPGTLIIRLRPGESDLVDEDQYFDLVQTLGGPNMVNSLKGQKANVKGYGKGTIFHDPWTVRWDNDRGATLRVTPAALGNHEELLEGWMIVARNEREVNRSAECCFVRLG